MTTNQLSESEELDRQLRELMGRAGADEETVEQIMQQGVYPYTASAVKEAEQKLLYDLDEIDNKPWRVFRQLAKIMPEYADTYTRYESFYSYGGSREVEKLIEKHEVTLSKPEEEA